MSLASEPRKTDAMHGHERGSASLEFIVAAVALLVPLVALTVTTSDIASARFAATTASRQGVRAFTRAEDPTTGMNRIRAITELALSDHGIDDSAWRMTTTCSGRSCVQRGSLVTLDIAIDVPLRFLPVLPGIDIAPRVTVSGSATARVSLTSVSR